MTTTAEHLWLHFSRLSESNSDDLVVIERGEGPYVFDTKGTGTSTASPASSWCRPATAAPRWRRRRPPRAEQLAYFPLWTYAHPPARSCRSG